MATTAQPGVGSIATGRTGGQGGGGEDPNKRSQQPAREHEAEYIDFETECEYLVLFVLGVV